MLPTYRNKVLIALSDVKYCHFRHSLILNKINVGVFFPNAPYHHYQPSMRDRKETEKSADDKLCLSRLKLGLNSMKQEQKKEKSLLIAQI